MLAQSLENSTQREAKEYRDIEDEESNICRFSEVGS